MIMTKKKMIKAAASLMLAAFVAVGFSTPAFAAVPDKDEVKYKGSGKVEVEFEQDVVYKDVKVKAKDSDGKAYKTSIISKDEDDITFKIKDFKNNMKYKISVHGVKKQGTKKYGTFKCTVKIPKASKSISKKKAKSIALSDAVRDYGIKKSTAKNFSIDSDTYKGTKVWEVEFDAKKKGKWYDYEYQISKKSGKILYSEQDD
jgi:uncharacterized membrane protein YkoI